jgi:DNA-binding beta-propeller fold protein YncE
MAFDPKDKLLMVTNNAPGVPPGSQPAFVSIIDTATNTIVAKTVFDGTVQHGAVTPNATGATEQPAWIGGATQKFFLSLPQVDGTGPGGIVQLDITGKVTHFYDFATFGIGACSPSGLVVGQNNVLGVNCQTAGSQVILFDPNANGGNGAVVKTFPQFSAGDEAWFDPSTGYFFFAENNNLGGPVLGIIDGNTDSFLQSIPTSPGAHSVAVDPVSGEVFVPEGGAPLITNSACPQGCIAVFALVPEPASLSLMATGFAGLAGVAWRRRRW